jgi:hypothetical protein
MIAYHTTESYNSFVCVNEKSLSVKVGREERKVLLPFTSPCFFSVLAQIEILFDKIACLISHFLLPFFFKKLLASV